MGKLLAGERLSEGNLAHERLRFGFEIAELRYSCNSFRQMRCFPVFKSA